MIISVQGSMAVGKTTALLALKRILGDKITISLEDCTNISNEIKLRKLDKNKINDYCKIQKMFIQNEVDRYISHKDKIAFFDSGLEGIEFYTLFYPVAKGFNWDIESILYNDLISLRNCRSDYIFYLLADKNTITQRKNNDYTRERNFFDFHMQNMFDRQIEWFDKFNNIFFIDCDKCSANEVAESICNTLSNIGIVL